jgi:hypothetical protein
MQPLLRALCCLSCSLLVSVTPCLAALIEPVQGNCYISHGQGFQPVKGEINAGPGDTVMVSPGGMAEIVYSEGCKIDVEPGMVTTIAASPPCGPPSQQVVQQPPPDNDGWAIGTTAALAAASLGVAIYAVQNNNNKNCGCSPAPASP